MYIERVVYYFKANAIPDGRRKAALLSLIGPDTFKLLRSLLVPHTPVDYSYNELKESLLAHFCPKRSQVFYRSQFIQCVQKSGTTIASYLSELQTLAKDCGFGNSLNNMLRDRLICGVSDTAIRKHLLTKGDKLTLKDAIKDATTMEAVVKDSKDLGPLQGMNDKSSSGGVHNVRHRPSVPVRPLAK